MILNKIVLSLFVGALAVLAGCGNSEGCTDINADNFDSNADKNTGCEYRYASTITVSGLSTNNPNGVPWDNDGTGPDIKVNFGKNSNSGFDFSTEVQNNTTAAIITLASNIQFTNEEWKYQILDIDLLGNETIATGTFNPITLGGSNVITITNSNVTIKFNYTVQ